MTLLWAANFVVTKFVVREIPPMLTVGLRMLLAAGLMIPLYRGRSHAWTRRDVFRLLALGVLGVGLNQLLFVLGVSRTSVAHAAIIIGLTPITVLALATVAGQEKLRASRMLGMVVALVGVLILQIAAGGSTTHTLLGDVLVFLGSLSFSVYTVAGKAMTHRLGTVAVNTVAYLASAVVLLPMTVWMSVDFRFSSVSWIGWAGLLYMSLFASVICYIIYYYALSHTSASRVSAFSYLQPLLATLLAIPMLGEYPTRSLFVGGALVFAGVLVAERS
jgi:drug/metabolite transporter (DMT)-like permease